MKSTSGTTPTGAKNLTRQSKVAHKKDIIAIIDAGFKAGLAKLKLGDLEIEYQPRQVATFGAISSLPGREVMDVDSSLDFVDKEAAAAARHERLMLEDPEAFEQAEIDRQLGS